MNDIYINTTEEVTSVSTPSSTGSSTSMSPENGPIHINTPIDINTEPYTELRPLQKKGLQQVQNQNTHEDPNKGQPLSDTDLNMLNQMSQEDFDALRTKTKGAISDHPILQTWPHKLVDAIIHSGVTALKGTYGIATGQIDPHSPEAIQSVTEGAGLVIGGAGGVATATGTDATHGAFLTYAKAPGLNKDNMLKAISLKEAGATEEQIFKATGAEHYEGKWGERVPYSGMQLKNTDLKGTTTLDKVMDHPAIFKADPSLKTTPIRHMTLEEELMSPGAHGFTDRDATFIAIKPGLTEDEFKQALVHETEHIVQKRHDLPGGGSSEAFKDTEYYLLEKTRDEQIKTVSSRLYALHDRNVDITLPKTTTENLIPEMATIAIKGKYTPHRLTAEELPVYKDILKYGLTKELESLRLTQNRLHSKDWENFDKYNRIKGEVAARVAEQELDVTADEIKDISYKRFMEEMVPAKQRINSPLDAGNSHSVVEVVGAPAIKTKEGIFTGVNHGEAWVKAGEPKGLGYDNGYVTSTGRFVDRKEALEIAIRSKKISKGERPDLGLLSEELKPWAPNILK